jgi:hypothetical protein
VRLVAKRSGDPTSVSCRPGLVSDLPSPMKTGFGATYELILLTDLLIADLDNHGHGRTEPPSATPASRPARQLRTGLDEPARARGIPRASGPRPACPCHARAVGIVNDEIIAGQRENVPAMYPLRSSPPRASSNLLAALVRRLKRVCAPHADRARGRPKPEFVSDRAC